MLITLQQRLAVGTGLMLAFGLTAAAQPGQFPAEAKFRNSGSRLYVVVRGDLNDFTGKRDPAVADFDKEDEAKQAAKALNDALKGDATFRYLYSWKKRSADEPNAEAEPSPGKGAKIEFQKPKFVDIGPLKKGEKGSVLAGKKGSGKIGDAKVTMEFGKDGKLIISGEVEGKGNWSETETGGVYMETDLSTFRGNIQDKTVSGLRFVKDSSKALAEWSVELQEASAANSVVGVWRLANNDGFHAYHFSKNGKVYMFPPLRDNFVPIIPTWRQEKGQVKITWPDGSVGSCDVKGDQLNESGDVFRRLSTEEIKNIKALWDDLHIE